MTVFYSSDLKTIQNLKDHNARETMILEWLRLGCYYNELIQKTCSETVIEAALNGTIASYLLNNSEIPDVLEYVIKRTQNVIAILLSVNPEREVSQAGIEIFVKNIVLDRSTLIPS